MPDPLVTVTAYPAAPDARVAKGALDEAGIEAVVEEQIERAKVRVHNVDAIRAGDVLTARVPALQEIDEADEEEPELECPACGSADVVKTPRALMFALVAVTAVGVGIGANVLQAAIFGIAASGLYFLMSGRWRCNVCGETWN
jgi:hypothetical protein